MSPLENAYDNLRLLRDEYRGKMNRSTDAAQEAAGRHEMHVVAMCSTDAERYREAFVAMNRAIQIVETHLED